GGGERLAVEAETDDAGVVEHHGYLLGDLQVLGDLTSTDDPSCREGVVTGDDRPEQTVGDGHLPVQVGVVHGDAWFADLELVDEGFTGPDRILGVGGDSVHIVGDDQPVPVD